MLSIFLMTIKKSWKSILVYGLVFIAYAWMIIAIYPSFRDTNVTDIYEQMPEGFMEAFGGIETSLSDFEVFISLEYLGTVWPFIMLAFIVAFITRYITKELESGVIDLLLSNPISRTKVLLTRALAVFIWTLILVAITFGSIILMGPMYDVDISEKSFLILSVGSLAFYIFIIGITFLFSAAFKERGRAIAATIGIFVGMYVINIVTNLKDNLKNIDYISAFHYFQPQKILVDEVITWWPDIIVLVGVGIISLVAAWYIFNKRDL